MSSVPADVSLASGKSEIFEIVLRFLPDWIQHVVLVLILLAVVASWVLKLKRKLAHRRAVRQGGTAVVPTAPDQGSGADHLGAYAPQQQAPRQPSGADFLGPYAPQHRPAPQQPAAAPRPSGADFLGSYAPPRAPGDAAR
ncbi:hypothetical protein AQJ30_19440 [Streptomyces longwoodensis]|uniref:Uncharacterized protein n=1 Tax=Streptomyces longwoodensis TaxID=68231 RepID=A0A101QVS2_9ACTN|nr:hypothetical protein [Streptomyces longwoodensis]KUN37039.1 hypothetical protein AQJ30_19440 [Streptomyces longwoodensis]